MIDVKLESNKVLLNSTNVKTFLVTDYPTRAIPGLLYILTHGKYAKPDKMGKKVSVNFALHLRKATVEYNWQMKTKMNRLQASVESYQTGKISDAPREEEVEALNALVHLRDNSLLDNYVEVFLMVTISCDDTKFFKRRIGAFKTEMKQNEIRVDELKFQQHEALSGAWAGGDNSIFKKYHGRIMDMDALAAFYPLLDGSLTDNFGAYLGHRVRDGTAVYKDFTYGQDDQNIIVSGTTGGGKSTVIKNLIESMRALKMKGYVYDVDGEYRSICNKLGGIWADFTMHSGKFVDPTFIESSLADEIDIRSLDSEVREKVIEADKARHQEAIDNTTATIGLLIDDFSTQKQNALEYALLGMWNDAGIREEDSNTWTIREGVGLKTLYYRIKKNGESMDESVKFREGARKLSDDLWSFFEGGKKYMFKEATDSSWIRENDLIVFHVASSVDNALDQKIGAAKIVMISNMVWHQIKRDLLKREKFSFGVYDELQRLIQNVYAQRTVYRDTTTGRKFNYQVVLGFNDPSILFPNNTGIWNNAKYNCMFSLKKDMIDKLAKYGAMPKEVIEEWVQLSQYTFIYRERTKNGEAFDTLRVELPETELKFAKTRGLN